MKYIDVYVTIWVFIYNTFFVIYSHLYGNMHVQYTVMVKNIGTPALPSDNAPLPENCCNYKRFGIHMFILFALEKHKKSEGKKAKSDIIPHRTKNGLDKIIGTLNLIIGSTPFGKK